MKLIATIFILSLSTYFCEAQLIQPFSLVNVNNGQKVNLTSLAGENGTVVIFHSSKCAYSNYYLDRIKRLYNEYSTKGIALILINSNSSKLVIEESFDNMAKYSKANDLQMPYLADKESIAQKALRATRSPEAFLLTAENGGFRVVYKGAIDDSPQAIGDINHSYLSEAILSLLNKSTATVHQTRAVGCLIK